MSRRVILPLTLLGLLAGCGGPEIKQPLATTSRALGVYWEAVAATDPALTPEQRDEVLKGARGVRAAAKEFLNEEVLPPLATTSRAIASYLEIVALANKNLSPEHRAELVKSAKELRAASREFLEIR